MCDRCLNLIADGLLKNTRIHELEQELARLQKEYDEYHKDAMACLDLKEQEKRAMLESVRNDILEVFKQGLSHDSLEELLHKVNGYLGDHHTHERPVGAYIKTPTSCDETTSGEATSTPHFCDQLPKPTNIDQIGSNQKRPAPSFPHEEKQFSSYCFWCDELLTESIFPKEKQFVDSNGNRFCTYECFQDALFEARVNAEDGGAEGKE